jgi:glycosyltransferase involved in cell wall biosynthesis
MTANKNLSIVIPTYNRADFLDRSLQVHIPLIKEKKIEIYISDNASTDNTSEVVNKWQLMYPFIHYFKNETNVGPDKNFELALKYPKTDYIWLLGDTNQIPVTGIEYVLNLINKKNTQHDVIVFNSHQRVIGIETKNYSDQNKLLSDLGWHMTLMSCLIYNSKLIADANFKKFHDTYFIQLGIILDYISGKKFNIHWATNQSIGSIILPNIIKNSWQQQTFHIWIEKWSDFIFSLPSTYKINAKLKCIKSHGIKSGLFSLSNLISLRKYNILNYKTYLKYYDLLPLTINHPRILILLITIFPINILNTIKILNNYMPCIVLKHKID